MGLLQRKQKWNENIREYFYDLQALFYEYDPSMDPEEFRKFFEIGISQELYGAYRMLREKTMDMDKFKDIVFRLEDITKHGTYTNPFPWGNRQEQTRTPHGKHSRDKSMGGNKDQAVTNRLGTTEITAPTTEQQIYARATIIRVQGKRKDLHII
ncbi:hypothetical protein JTB14_011448 [Gonioctena quinquepunctata]|nr:hypothetical protein JTB14_011448 [Gonioctena quinquepunctata]